MKNISENTGLLIFDLLFCSEYISGQKYILNNIDDKISKY